MKTAVPLALLLTFATSAAAQEAAPSRFDAARIEAPAIAPLATPQGAVAAPAAAPVPAAAPAPEPAAEQRRSALGTALHLVGGALVGGWVGFVGSQVALSDWEKETNDSFRGERAAWVGAGMVVGVVGSRLIGRTSAPAPRGGVVVQRPGSARDVLTLEQIRGAGVTNAYDLVVTLRKEWLVTRGTNSWQETPRGAGGGMGSSARMSVTPGQAPVVVYMDDMRLGGPEELREIAVEILTEVRFLPPQEATYRFGSGHSHGAILLVTSS